MSASAPQPPQAQPTEPPAPPKARGESWLVRSVAIVSLCGVALSLFGYGVALAVETQFGIPHSVIFNSPFELLELSTWGIAQLIVGLGGALKELDRYGVLLLEGWPVFLVALVLWSLVVLAGKFNWAERVRARPTGFVATLFRRPDFRRESMVRLLSRGAAYALLSALLAPLTALSIVVLASAACIVLAIVPIIGMSAGEAHIRTWVVGDLPCQPLRNDATRAADKRGETRKFAACAAVQTADGRPIARGRVVFATSEALVLYDPASGAVRRVPVKDHLVEVLDAL